MLPVYLCECFPLERVEDVHARQGDGRHDERRIGGIDRGCEYQMLVEERPVVVPRLGHENVVEEPVGEVGVLLEEFFFFLFALRAALHELEHGHIGHIIFQSLPDIRFGDSSAPLGALCGQCVGLHISHLPCQERIGAGTEELGEQLVVELCAGGVGIALAHIVEQQVIVALYLLIAIGQVRKDTVNEQFLEEREGCSQSFISDEAEYTVDGIKIVHNERKRFRKFSISHFWSVPRRPFWAERHAGIPFSAVGR